METKAGDPGAFAHFDLNRVASPAFVVDEVAVRRNLAVLKDVRDRGDARVLLALKAAIVAMAAPGTAKAARTAGEWPFAVLYWIWMASLFRRNIRLPW